MAILASSVTLSNLILLPILCVISVPLVMSAWFTICFSVVALSFRVFLFYAELCYSLISSYFVISTSPNLSLLTLSSSEPTSPILKARSPDPCGSFTLEPSSATSVSGSGSPRRRPTVIGRSKSAIVVSQMALSTLVSGDESRDFEGVGGWRCYGGDRKHCISPVVAGRTLDNDDHDAGEDADERSWLSINDRLELPSQRRLSLVLSDDRDHDSSCGTFNSSASEPGTPIRCQQRRRAATMFARSSSSYYRIPSSR